MNASSPIAFAARAAAPDDPAAAYRSGLVVATRQSQYTCQTSRLQQHALAVASDTVR